MFRDIFDYNSRGRGGILFVVLVMVSMVIASGSGAAAGLEDTILKTPGQEGFLFDDVERLVFNSNRSIDPQLLIDDEDNRHLIWSDTRNDPDQTDTSYIHEIFYKKYNKFGKVIVDDTRLTDATSIINSPHRFYLPAPSVALDSDGNIQMSYQDYTKNFYAGIFINVEIYYMKIDGSLDTDGEPADRSDLVLIDEQRVSQGAAHSGSSDLVLDSEDSAHIVWYDHRSAWYNWEIYYEKISKNGDVLVDDKRLTYYLDYAAGAEIDVDSEDNLHVIFKSYDWTDDLNSLYYMKLDNDGDILINATKLTDEGKTSPNPYGKGNPLFAIDSQDTTHLIWNDERDADNNEVYYWRLNNDGEPLTDAPLRLTENSGRSSVQNIIVDHKDRIYIGLADNTPGYYQLYFALIDSDGTVLYEPFQVTESEALSESPSFAFDSHGFVHIAFHNNVILPTIYYMLMKPLELDLAFVPTGVKGGILDISIYEDDVLIEDFSLERTSGQPVGDAIIIDLDIDLDSSYTVEIEYTNPAKKNVNGAVPLKVYVVEGGEFGKQLLPETTNDNQGNSQKVTAVLELDDFIAGYF